ncbi:MAG: tape measure protein, partial [Thermoguttaceae bacterium]|nr:tape measure protein [Thermoguttaceae bacterium]
SAMGKGEEGIDSVTRALGQMRSTGRVNAQDMMQLTSVGIKAWDYLAKGMGKSVAEVRKMSENGEIDANTAIKHIMSGLNEFDGMMDKMSNRTVKGLWSNIKDTFQQSIILDWGEGLQKGAINGLSEFKKWLDNIDPLLEKAGTSLSKLGESLSTSVFDFLNGAAKRFEEAVNTEEFANADLGGKIKRNDER